MAATSRGPLGYNTGTAYIRFALAVRFLGFPQRQIDLQNAYTFGGLRAFVFIYNDSPALGLAILPPLVA